MAEKIGRISEEAKNFVADENEETSKPIEIQTDSNIKEQITEAEKFTIEGSLGSTVEGVQDTENLAENDNVQDIETLVDNVKEKTGEMNVDSAQLNLAYQLGIENPSKLSQGELAQKIADGLGNPNKSRGFLSKMKTNPVINAAIKTIVVAAGVFAVGGGMSSAQAGEAPIDIEHDSNDDNSESGINWDKIKNATIDYMMQLQKAGVDRDSIDNFMKDCMDFSGTIQDNDGSTEDALQKIEAIFQTQIDIENDGEGFNESQQAQLKGFQSMAKDMMEKAQLEFGDNVTDEQLNGFQAETWSFADYVVQNNGNDGDFKNGLHSMYKIYFDQSTDSVESNVGHNIDGPLPTPEVEPNKDVIDFGKSLNQSNVSTLEQAQKSFEGIPITPKEYSGQYAGLEKQQDEQYSRMQESQDQHDEQQSDKKFEYAQQQYETDTKEYPNYPAELSKNLRIAQNNMMESISNFSDQNSDFIETAQQLGEHYEKSLDDVAENSQHNIVEIAKTVEQQSNEFFNSVHNLLDEYNNNLYQMGEELKGESDRITNELGSLSSQLDVDYDSLADQRYANVDNLMKQVQQQSKDFNTHLSAVDSSYNDAMQRMASENNLNSDKISDIVSQQHSIVENQGNNISSVAEQQARVVSNDIINSSQSTGEQLSNRMPKSIETESGNYTGMLVKQYADRDDGYKLMHNSSYDSITDQQWNSLLQEGDGTRGMHKEAILEHNMQELYAMHSDFQELQSKGMSDSDFAKFLQNRIDTMKSIITNNWGNILK